MNQDVKFMNWRDYYKLPLRYDEEESFMIYSEDNRNIINWSTWFLTDKPIHRLTTNEKSMLIESINTNTKISGLLNSGDEVISDGNELLISNESVLVVRGWGMLTGAGGYNLTDEEAMEIQDGLIKYIAELIV